MRIRRTGEGRTGLAALLILAAVSSLHAGLEGRWRLVDERGGAGPDHPGRATPPARLEILREGTRLTGRAWTAEDPARVHPWPVFLHGSEPLPIVIEERTFDERSARLRARYTVELPSGDGQTLRVNEEYALSEDRGTLEGTLRLTLFERGAERGTWVIRRRFEREP